MDHRRPWVVESDVIELMQPPLNLAGNVSHPVHQRLWDSRLARAIAGARLAVVDDEVDR
jgi:hypothetical protein